jgi:predicted AAA+ superfamily ATPase
MTQISDVLYEGNPWWRERFRVEYKEREIYSQVKRFIKTKQILAFTGLRRVGKTTVMLKAIEDSISGGMDPKDILFFSFDELKNADIREIIKEYETMLNKDIRSGRHLLVLDEIQKLDGWADKLKWIYDLYSGNTKILISGSESLFIRKSSKETLAGRIFEFKVTGLSFREFLGFTGQIIDPIGLYSRELTKRLEEFIHIQGFPELVGTSDPLEIKKYIMEGVVEKVVYKEIPELFNVRNTEALNSLLAILMNDPGQILEHTKLAKELGISRYSASKYLEYMEDAFLVRKLYNYSRNARKSERSLRRYYPTIISVDLAFKQDALYRSKVFEWLIVNQLDAKYFWRDAYKHEVDVVLEKGPKPIEIKYGGVDTEGLTAFMTKFKVNAGAIITKEIERRIKEGPEVISLIPAYKFLLSDLMND